MTKDELVAALVPFGYELDLVIEHEGNYYEVGPMFYGVVSSSGTGVVLLVSGETADHLRFKTKTELL